MLSSFEEFEALVIDQLSAIVAAELALDPRRAARYGAMLAPHLVSPRVIGCQPAVPERDPRPAALRPVWLVCAVRTRSGPRVFIGYDPEHLRFGRGYWEGPTAWYLEDNREDGRSLLALLEQVAGEATDEAA
jgi:hypothetical protein